MLTSVIALVGDVDLRDCFGWNTTGGNGRSRCKPSAQQQCRSRSCAGSPKYEATNADEKTMERFAARWHWVCICASQPIAHLSSTVVDKTESARIRAPEPCEELWTFVAATTASRTQGSTRRRLLPAGPSNQMHEALSFTSRPCHSSARYWMWPAIVCTKRPRKRVHVGHDMCTAKV